MGLVLWESLGESRTQTQGIRERWIKEQSLEPALRSWWTAFLLTAEGLCSTAELSRQPCLARELRGGVEKRWVVLFDLGPQVNGL